MAKADLPQPTLDELALLAHTMGRERWRVSSDVAQVVANYLRCHPRVQAVSYPGLKQDPQFVEASHTLVGGFGPVVCYRVDDSWQRLVCGEEDPKDLILTLEHRLADQSCERPSS